MKKLVLILICLFIFGTACAETGRVRIEDGWLNIRKEPDFTADVVGKLENGVNIEYENSDKLLFLKLMSGDSVIGYIATNYVEKPSKVADIFEHKTYVVLTDYPMLSDIKGDVYEVGKIYKGDIVQAVLAHTDFAHIIGGGFVPRRALKEQVN